MNRSDDLHQLEARAADAARDLRGLAAGRPVPAPPSAERLEVADAPAPRSARSPRLLAAAAGIVALAALAAGLWAVAGSDDAEPAGPVVAGSARPHVVTNLPDGFVLAGASTPRPAPDGEGALAIYGPADDDPRVGVALLVDSTLADLVDDDTPTFRVGDVEARDLSPLGLAPTMVSIDAGATTGRSVLAVGREISREELARLSAAALERAAANPGSPAELTDAELPGGWRRIASLPEGLAATYPVVGLRGGSTSSHTVAYATSADDDQTGSMLIVDARPGDRAVQHSGALFAGGSEVVDLDGREAVVTGHVDGRLGGSFVTVAILASPTEVVRVTGWGVPRDAVLAAAASVAPISREEMEGLARSARLGLLGDEARTDLSEGTLPDGTAWALSVQDGETLMLRVDAEPTGDGSSSGSSSSWGPDAPVRSTTVTEVGGRRFVALLTGSSVARIELRPGVGQTIGLDVEPAPAEAALEDGLGFVVFEATAADLDIALLDSSGRELAVLPLDESGFSSELDQILSGAPTTTVPGD